MARGVRAHSGRLYRDPGGYLYEPHNSWESDPLLERKPWGDLALFWKYLIHLAVWEWDGREVWPKGDAAATLVKRGQIYMSLDELGKKAGWSKMKVKRVLALFDKDGRTVTESRPRGTLVTIVNYEAYQDPAFYRVTRNNLSTRAKAEKRYEECDDECNDGKSSTTSAVRPDPEGGSETTNDTRNDTVTIRGGRGNSPSPPFPSWEKTENSSRAREAASQAAIARLGAEATPCSWWAIANAVRTGFWSGYSPRIRALQIAEAATAGPPPGEIEPEIRAALLQEAAELGISVEMGRETGGEEDHDATDHEPIWGGNDAALEEAPRAVPVPPEPEGGRQRARERPPDRVPAGEDGVPRMDSDLAPCGLVCSHPDPP